MKSFNNWGKKNIRMRIFVELMGSDSSPGDRVLKVKFCSQLQMMMRLQFRAGANQVGGTVGESSPGQAVS